MSVFLQALTEAAQPHVSRIYLPSLSVTLLVRLVGYTMFLTGRRRQRGLCSVGPLRPGGAGELQASGP